MIKLFRDRYGFLSNFHPAKLKYLDIEYPTSEHAFQAMKTFSISERKHVATLPSPRLAKAYGKTVQLRSDWEKAKVMFMEEIVLAKFEQNPILAELLEKTGDEELVEGNLWHDNIWGNCNCHPCLDIPGMNLLGNILMQVRKQLREEGKEDGNEECEKT